LSACRDDGVSIFRRYVQVFVPALLHGLHVSAR
jgi:hypothetical protein